jgi:hypothetical protein
MPSELGDERILSPSVGRWNVSILSFISDELLILIYFLHATTSHLMFNMLLSKLYTNSLMSTLNARIGFKGVIANAIPLDVSKLASPEVRRISIFHPVK